MVALLLAIALGGQQPAVTARVNREAVALGDDVVLTITVEARGSAPVRIIDPDLSGLELRNTRDRTTVAMQGGVPTRVTTRVLTLRTLRAGTVVIGSVRVHQGDEVEETAPLTIAVSAPDAGVSAGLEPRIREVVRRAPPPVLEEDQVAMVVLTSADSVMLGEQVDLVVVAWFPREVRSRLRSPPTLAAPEVRGAWVYQRPAPSGIALSRRVGGGWYDLYVLHEVVFPLTSGRLEVGHAMVSYSLPLSYSFLSRELRHEVQSEPFAVSVAPQPRPRGLSGFQGAAGSGLNFRVDVPPGELRIGEAVRVRAEVQGRGNVALWPEPRLDWPVGLRAYPQEVNVGLASEQGLLGGAKAFHYLVVADSAGTHRVPAPSYVYFDVETRQYVELRAAAIEFVTPSGTGSVAAVQTVPPLMTSTRRALAASLAAALPVWARILILAFPPLVAFAIRHPPRRLWPGRERMRRAPEGPGTSPLARLEREFQELLERLVPDAHMKGGDELANALRAAGIEAPLAAHASRVRDRLRQAVYGPGGSTDPDELAAEVHEVLPALLGGAGKATRSLSAGLALILLCVGLSAIATAQSPERLYEAGAVRIAADSFAARAAEDPLVTAHWYNLGNALNRLGESVRARAAWLRAARLAPRHPAVKRALATSSAPNLASERVTWVAPVTPAEAFGAAAVVWLACWIAIGLKVRARYAALLVALAVLVAAYGAYVTSRYEARVALVLTSGTPMRPAPYGPALATRELDEGDAVRIEREQGAWVLVRQGEARGWLLRSEVVRL
ncbi:MAG: hypothetical protein GTN62_01610 [Gemmatimonadales bacterium]|nr:hypothetical protein [Gemmatimonadales bacterium]NIN48799.1 hypothetical protein [Gemmatimonadales bacterium]NIP06263.1 hypothetical protein [Gemmatimonadales bacterium]NIR00150.1 hypothetical protein [Gemmatimonadales bacterium]NIS64553.1 hypothetical protein [Gemmatimonadales bacterium]